MANAWWVAPALSLISALVGAVAAFGGVVWTQSRLGRRERERDQARDEREDRLAHEREQRERRERHAAQQRDVYVEMARHAQHRQFAMGRLTDAHSLRNLDRPDLMHLDVLTALARLYASRHLFRAWAALLATGDWLDSLEAADTIPRDPDSTQPTLPGDHPLVLATLLACELVVLGARTALDPDHDTDDEQAVGRMLSNFANQIQASLAPDPEHRDEVVASLKFSLALLQHPAGDRDALAPDGPPPGPGA